MPCHSFHCRRDDPSPLAAWASASRRGFTLLEVIIYIAVSSLIVVMLMNSVIVMLADRNKTEALSDVQQALSRALERVQVSTVNATSLTAADNGVLLLGPSAAAGGEPAGPTAFYYLAGGAIYLKEGNGTPVALTPSNVNVTEFLVANRRASSGPPIVKLRVTATDTASAPPTSSVIDASFSLRQ